jgi:hypothetical protein
MFYFVPEIDDPDGDIDIKSDTLVEICKKILEYDNGADKKSTNDDTVRFMNFSGELILETSEVTLKYILQNEDEKSKEVSKEMVEDNNTFWNMDHKEIETVTFKNPSHSGEAVYWYDPEDSSPED